MGLELASRDGVIVNAKDLKIGQIGVIVDTNTNNHYRGMVLIHTDVGWVVVGKPCWWKFAPDFTVRILQPGEQLVVTPD